MKPKASQVERWKRWFNKINPQIAQLVSFEQMRKQFWQILAQSPISRRPSPLIEYLNYALTDEIILIIGRLGETQKRAKGKLSDRSVYSLIALLQEFEEHSDYFTRLRYVGWKNKPIDPDYSDLGPGAHSVPMSGADHFRLRAMAFDRYVGKGKGQLNFTDIARDRKRLEVAVRNVQHFRNKFVAHNDLRQASRSSLKFTELDHSIATIVEVAKKYHLLLTRSQYNYELPGVDITDLFQEPWISSKEAASVLKTKFKFATEQRNKRGVSPLTLG